MYVNPRWPGFFWITLLLYNSHAQLEGYSLRMVLYTFQQASIQAQYTYEMW